MDYPSAQEIVGRSGCIRSGAFLYRREVRSPPLPIFAVRSRPAHLRRRAVGDGRGTDHPRHMARALAVCTGVRAQGAGFGHGDVTAERRAADADRKALGKSLVPRLMTSRSRPDGQSSGSKIGRLGARVSAMMKAAPWWVTILFALSLALNLWFAGVPDWRWIPAALAGWYIADLLSGLTHLYMDYRPCTPGIGLDRMFHYAGSRESDEYLAL